LCGLRGADARDEGVKAFRVTRLTAGQSVHDSPNYIAFSFV
jgi:hypothetical protein